MTTQIFDSYSDFMKREDKKINGVSKAFSENNPDFEKDNETNEGCWDCSGCRFCRYSIDCRRCLDCRFLSDCSGCIGYRGKINIK